MFKLGAVALILGGGLWVFPPKAYAQPAPDFKQVYGLLKEHLPGVTEAELNRAAVQGLVSQFGNRATLVPKGASSVQEGPGLTATNVFDSSFAYFRVNRLTSAVPKEIQQAYQKLAAGNRLRGLVLDLRYSRGEDYSAAADTVSLFLTRELALADWGTGMTKSAAKVKALEVPVVALVNAQTGGAPELLAELIRQTRSGLVIGKPTAGEAAVTREFTLGNGDRLRLATMPVKLADGSPLPQKGVEPDIVIDVGSEEDKAYYADAFTAATSTNGVSPAGPARRRYSEADLARERRLGIGSGQETEIRKPALQEPVIYDPMLARALDLLKGLALIRQPRS